MKELQPGQRWTVCVCVCVHVVCVCVHVVCVCTLCVCVCTLCVRVFLTPPIVVQDRVCQYVRIVHTVTFRFHNWLNVLSYQSVKCSVYNLLERETTNGFSCIFRCYLYAGKGLSVE